MASDTEAPVGGDFIKWMCNPNYCIGKVLLKAAAEHIKIGSLIRDNTGYVLVANASEAHAVIALEEVASSTAIYIKALIRGPALIDSVEVLAVDAVGGVTWAECLDLIAAGVIDYPVKATSWTTQST